LILSQAFFLALNLSALRLEYQKASKTVESFLLSDLGRRQDTLARLNLELSRQRSLAKDTDRMIGLSKSR
jgi:hypothetical protein